MAQTKRFTVRIHNKSATSPLKMELFYKLNSFLDVQKGDYANGNFLYIPLTSHESLNSIALGITPVGVVGFTKDGEVIPGTYLNVKPFGL